MSITRHAIQRYLERTGRSVGVAQAIAEIQAAWTYGISVRWKSQLRLHGIYPPSQYRRIGEIVLVERDNVVCTVLPFTPRQFGF